MKKIELTLINLLLIAANFSLLGGSVNDGLVYLPQAVASGQFYRLLTHPFVHVSAYHLLIDGLAFFLLYWQMEEKSLIKRMTCLLGIHISILAAVTFFSPLTASIGYCGLSGIDHGLMALWCLEQLVQKDPLRTKTALITLLILIGKSVYEMLTGTMLFASLHPGSIGVPVVASHAGGIIGALVVFAVLNRTQIHLLFQGTRRTAVPIRRYVHEDLTDFSGIGKVAQDRQKEMV